MKQTLAVFILSLAAAPALASDPTPLFILFVVFPSAIVALFCFALAFAAPKAGIYVSGFFIIMQVLVLGWADSVGYLNAEGGWFLLTFFMNVAALLTAAKKNEKRKFALQQAESRIVE